MSLPRRARKIEQVRRVLRVARLRELHRLRLGYAALWVREEEHRDGFLPDAPLGVRRRRAEVYARRVLGIKGRRE